MRACKAILVAVGVMIQRGLADADLVFDSVGYNRGRYGPDPHQYYHSTNISSPLLLVNHWDLAGTDDTSHIFLTLDDPDEGGTVGPVIYRADDLSLVYSEPRWSVAHNAYVGQHDGHDYLVFIGQERLAGGSLKTCLLYDSTYTLAYNVSSPGPVNASMGTHECQLTANGSVVVVLTKIVPFDLTAVGGPRDGKILDNIVQEIDISSGELLWTWRASDHYKMSDSFKVYKNGTGAYDYMHINSAQRTSEGNFLISARHTHSIIHVERETFNVIWTLGGKNSSFSDMSGGHATDFAWQHHARFINGDSRMHLTMFDNHNDWSIIGCMVNCTRGKRVELDLRNYTARLVSEFYHPEKLVSAFEGSYQPLNNGNVFLGWGANPTFTEHTSAGDCVLDIQFDIWRPDTGYPVNYRAFKKNWEAYPTWDPEIAVHKSNSSNLAKVYVSWNGATEVAMWQLLVGFGRDEVTQIAVQVLRKGFETEISLELDLPFTRAAAIDKDGRVLGMTAIVDLSKDNEGAGNI